MSGDWNGREETPRTPVRRVVLALTDGCPGDRVKISDGTWNQTISHGEAVVGDEDRASRLLAQRVKGKPFLRVQERLD